MTYSHFSEFIANARQSLLDQRLEHGHWEGELSSSALSTAIAVSALASYRSAQIRGETRDSTEQVASHSQLEQLIEGGLEWLVRTQNADGGWGDTTLSFSNISTTAIVWATFAIAQAEESCVDTVHRAARWLENAAGSLEPSVLATAIADRYGKDRTFSVPILTTLAIGGRLGKTQDAWRYVPQLPFELAACPYQWFQWIKLPVVSYALPALIAIGQVRHHQRPTRNPLWRVVRNQLRHRTLNVLRSVQPTTGGFLEATPLTSFVVMSLVHAGRTDFAVTQEGVRFLIDSVRTDGSWPIDTNLATWVTSLSVNALGTDTLPPGLDDHDRKRIQSWLLDQQYRTVHPYTHTPPGAWAWTDLSGGVPDADDTPGALLALRQLAPQDPQCIAAAEAGVTWLLNLQNRDGGIPTFCKGWGNLPFDRSSQDLTAHAVRAWVAWQDDMSEVTKRRIRTALRRAARYLSQQQRADGAWVPLWFGNQHSPSEENPTYGTSRVLLAAEALRQHVPPGLDWAAAATWLLKHQNRDGGWGGDAGTPSSLEETAFAVEALSAVWDLVRTASSDTSTSKPTPDEVRAAVARAVEWLSHATDHGTRFPASPVGFYFAKLWYFEKLYPYAFVVAALGRAAQVLDDQT
ncbi:MAG: prenyltransferase/squalene oxidase repeat-containing protein [Pirellulaceae bacterium]